VSNRKVAHFNLQKLGHRVESAENREEAMDRFKTGSFDTILMNIMMPMMDGYEATREIREIEQENNFQSIRIIAMTADTEKGEMDECIDLGMDDYISKPFRPESLEEILQKQIH
jgi:CheY-like chemotaxis protein